MWNRCVPLASLAVAFLFGGCVIYTEPQNKPPAPPPPPQRVEPTPAQPAQPGQPARKRLPAKWSYKPKTQPGQPPAENMGTLLVAVTDGTCRISIDGVDKGVTNQVEEKLAPGVHAVSCAPDNGATQTQQATIEANAVTTAYFSLATPTNTQVTTPVPITPPVGRPTPGATQ